MSRISHPKHKPLEVTIMFEPHRLQEGLLRTAYAYLVPVSRRRMPKSQLPTSASQAYSPKRRRERSF